MVERYRRITTRGVSSGMICLTVGRLLSSIGLKWASVNPVQKGGCQLLWDLILHCLFLDNGVVTSS